MALDTKAQFVGLVTATAEATAAPGALRIADNVTLRKEGALMLRPSFASSALTRAYLAAFPYRGSLYYIGADGTVYGPSQAAINYASASLIAPVRTDVVSAKESRNNLYVAAKAGVFKLSSLADTTLRPTGVLPNHVPIYRKPLLVTTGTPLLLAPNQQVAYRVVAKYTDPNGLVVRSRPSGAVIADTTGGVASSPVVEMYLRNHSPFFPTPDEVEIYRSRVFPVTAQIDDEMQLVATIKASEFLPPNYGYSFTDRVLDNARGATLYTSPSRGGMENAADRPPGAACLERFRGSLFFGNVLGPQRLTVSWKFGATNTLTNQASGRGIRNATGNITNGSAAITGVTPLTGLQVGMYMQSTPASLLSGVIVSIVGSTVTLSQAATGTAAGNALSFYDSITVGPAALPDVIITDSYKLGDSPPSYSVAGWRYTAYEVTPPVPGSDITMVLEATSRGTAPFEVRATHPETFTPPLAAGGAATGTPSTADVFPNGLMWSEPDEPEHVPLKNFARVGDHGKAILGLVATRDRLLIFKEDGLFMLTGDTARNFSIQPLDTTCLCILPGSIRRLKNTVYVLTNLGLVEVDENGGVSVISRPIQTELAPIVQQIRAAAKTNGGLYLMPGLSGTTGAGDDASAEYWLALGTTSPSFGGQVLVYSVPRGGFTTYSFGASTPVALATDGEGQPIALTSNALLSPTTAMTAITARISPRAFSDPGLMGKLWTHVAAGFSRLTGTFSVSAKFSSSESMLTTDIVTEQMEAPAIGPTIELPNGSLLRHPIPNAVRRAYMLYVELIISVSTGTFTLELLGAESRENTTNKRPTHASGVG